MVRGGKAVWMAPLLLLAACGSDKSVPGQSPEESAALNDAAAMLDNQVLDVPSDSLTADENIAIETESGSNSR